jgi:hypothetical protein
MVGEVGGKVKHGCVEKMKKMLVAAPWLTTKSGEVAILYGVRG